MRIIITIGPVATDIASRRYLNHAQFIEYEEGRRRYGLNRLSSNEIEATWGMQLEDPHVPKDVVEGQARIRVGSWTEFYSKAPTHKVFRSIRNLGPPRIGLAAEGDQARSKAEDEGRLMRQLSELFDAVDKDSAVKSAFIHCSRTEGGGRGAPSQDN